MQAALTVLHLVLIVNACLSQSALNVSQLNEDLLTLKPNIRPVKNLSLPTVVNISFHLMSIITLDTVSQKLVSNGWLNVVWQSDYFTWDPKRYGVASITPSVDKMWRPRLTVKNTLKELKALSEDYIVMNLHHDGLVSWYPAERFETFCYVDVTFFPFDRQHCKWQLFSWAESTDEVVLQPILPVIDMDSFQESGEWNLLGSKVSTKILFGEGRPFSYLIYEVTLQRKPLLLAMTVMLPMMVLSVVNVFVFTIPSEAGERLTYSMTSFLTFGVFMGYIVDLMPSSSETLSIMAAVLSCQLILSALYVLLCVLSLRLFHRDPHKHPVPARLQTTIVYLELMLCLGPPSQPQTEVVHSGDLVDGFNRTDVKGSRLKGHLDRWAKKRQAKQEAYSQPQDMTWQRVSRSLDKLFFRVFFCLVTVNHIAYTSTMACIYHS